MLSLRGGFKRVIADDGLAEVLVVAFELDFYVVSPVAVEAEVVVVRPM